MRSIKPAPTQCSNARKGYGVQVPGVYVLPEPNLYRPYIKGLDGEASALAALEMALKLYDMASTGRRAAIIVERVISAGGVLVPPKSFMQALRKAADERGMLPIFDEAQTAFGRIGERHASDHFGIVPDIITTSKTMGGGLPLAAVATTPRIEDDIHAKGFACYTSHVSDPLPAMVGLAVLETIRKEQLLERARTMGAYLRERFTELQSRYEAIGDVRGLSMLLGVELVKDRESREPYHQNDRLAKAASSGVVTMGVREASAPLSYLLGNSEYAGYHVELCERILGQLVPNVRIQYQPVTSQNRIPLTQKGTVDIECGSTSNTAIRKQQVAFALTTYVTEARFAVKAASGIEKAEQLRGKTIVTTTGTTLVQRLRKLERQGLAFNVVYGKDHADSFLLVESGRADAFAMDDNTLAGKIASAKNPNDDPAEAYEKD